MKFHIPQQFESICKFTAVHCCNNAAMHPRWRRKLLYHRVSEWVEFNASLDTIQVISEADIVSSEWCNCHPIYYTMNTETRFFRDESKAHSVRRRLSGSNHWGINIQLSVMQRLHLEELTFWQFMPCSRVDIFRLETSAIDISLR